MPDRAAWGQKLFFDARLSANGTVACATCHNPARAFTDDRPTSIGIHGSVGQRNSPTVLNAFYTKHQFWDGRVNTLEQQAAMPITNPFEMGSASVADAVSRIAADQDYQSRFMEAFGRGVNEQDMLSAIAAYEQTLVSFDSPYDHFIAGDASALGDSAKRDLELFNTKARCNKAMLCRTTSGMRLFSWIMIFTTLGSESSGILSSNRRDRLSARWHKQICRLSIRRRSQVIW